MSKKIISQLKELKRSHEGLSPNPEWMKQSRERLMSQIQNSLGAQPVAASFSSSFETFLKLFISPKAYYVLRTAAIFILAIGITIGGWIGGVSASHSCLPGDFCYNVKLAAEKTQVAVASVTGNTDGKVALHLEFASRRLDEIRLVKDSHQVDAVKELKKSLTSVSDTLSEVKDRETATRVAKDITKKTSDIARTLNTVTQNDVNVSIATVKEIADATKLVNDTGIQALQIAIEGQPGGTPSDDIKALVVDKIDSILDTNKNAQVAVYEVKNSVDALASSTLLLTQLAVNTSTATSTLPPVVLSPVTSTIINIDAVVNVMATSSATLSETIQKIDQTTQKAEVVASEAKALLEGNKVDEAFEKVKTLNVITTETRQDVLQAQENLNTQLLTPNTAPVSASTSTSTPPSPPTTTP